jgi:hypothetical protein
MTPMALAPIFKKVYWSLAGAGCVYVLCLLSLGSVWVQRQ